jgi:hypothetical protein
MSIKNAILFVLLSLLLTSCSGESVESTNSTDSLKQDTGTTSSIHTSDTLEIWDSIAEKPFLFEHWLVSLDSVLLFLPSDVTLNKSLQKSEYEAGMNDSITEIHVGQSVIQYIKSPSVGFINYAVIMDKDIEFVRGIHIGDRYENIIQKLNIKPQQKTFTCLYINHGDANSVLIFEFKEERLFKATFWPYTG